MSFIFYKKWQKLTQLHNTKVEKILGIIISYKLKTSKDYQIFLKKIVPWAIL